MNGGNPVSSNRVSPMSPSSAGFFLDPRVEAGHADELALVAQEQSPYHLASPASISVSPAKRRAEDAPEALGKRLRSVPSAVKSVEKTIRFDELYDDGNARYKHRIVQYNEEWFILRCDEHNMHFPYRAASAAGSHLKAYAHNGPSAALPAVIEAFGIRVSDMVEEIVVACPNDSRSLVCVRQSSVTASDITLLNDAANPHSEARGVAGALGIGTCGQQGLCEEERREGFTAVASGANPSAMERKQRNSSAEQCGWKEARNAINRNHESQPSRTLEQTCSTIAVCSQTDGSLGDDQQSDMTSSGQWWQVVA
ncbi:hypothetical protein BDP55DRAFT_419448 [Colletotrichum godetiae]|uniref:Uncharacterized protein n=1 Tax=Colletotrichum godetiae TaxID=1209918 RepID=A0AAJ0A805_9PEZI|nr:uncharacterized protein BDP55DRAFT_419448 [Colletotrichum godetiae]KAK1657734.1 hypothetical protein BDP55DRAFT_419448 [Colletotrichum godetiae]